MKKRAAALAASCAFLAACGGAAAHPQPSASSSAAARLKACATVINIAQANGTWGPGGLQGAGAAADEDPGDCSGFGNGAVIAEMDRLFPGNCGVTATCPGSLVGG